MALVTTFRGVMVRTSGPLPVRHRPRHFSGVVGQTAAVEALSRMVSAGRVPSQVLFAGPSGCGKTTLARILAGAVLCGERRSVEPCGVCASCRMVWEGSHPDLIEVDAASYGGKESILELSSRSALLPLMGGSRVFVVDEAHGMSSAAGQAFLKTLEEPAPGVHFFFCTTEPDRLLPTIRSRCVEMHLSLPSAAEISELLVRVACEEGWLLDGETARLIVSATDGRMGVRGVLNTLSRVAPSSAGRISPSDVALIVGSGSPSLEALWSAVSSSDPAGALMRLDEARASFPESSLRHSFISWCRGRVVQEFSSGRLEVWRGLLAELASAEGVALDAWVVGAAHASRAAGPPPPDVVAVPSGAVREAATFSPDELSARLLAAATPHPDFLPELLGRCVVLEAVSGLEVHTPERLVAAVDPVMPLLRTAAGRLGMPIRMVVV